MKYIIESQLMREIQATILKIKDSDAPVLITGDTGSGKEIISEMLHDSGKRLNLPHVKINCAAMPASLIEAELFGTMKGSFTGSTGNRQGLFIEAGQGTIFLDEIGEMPNETQSKLLRVLQERCIRPIGGNNPININCRIIAATNVHVPTAIMDGRLRSDLYYRLNVIQIRVPNLAERPDDIPHLALHFLEHFTRLEGKIGLTFKADSLHILKEYPWPGNVRELRNAVHRAVLLSMDTIDVRHIMGAVQPLDLANTGSYGSNLTMMQQTERQKIYEVLIRTGWNKLETAKTLGIGRQTLYNKIITYSIIRPKPETVAA